MLQLAEIQLPDFILADQPTGETIVAAVAGRDHGALRHLLATSPPGGALCTMLNSLALHFEGKVLESTYALTGAYPDREWEAVALTFCCAYAIEEVRLDDALQILNQASQLNIDNFGPNQQNIKDIIAKYAASIENAAYETRPKLNYDLKIRRSGPTAYVISYPRSGNTRAMNALRYIFQTPGCSVFAGDGALFSRCVYDPADTSVAFIKDHVYRTAYLKEKTAYLVRDGRDAMISLCHFVLGGTEHEVTDAQQFGDFLIHMARDYEYGFWADSVRLALEGQEAGADLKIWRYEDIGLDPAAYLSIAAYIAADRIVGRDPCAMVQSIELGREKLKTGPEWGLSGDPVPDLFRQWSRNRGDSNWRSVFDARARRIFHELGGTEILLRFGYETDPDWWKAD